VSAAISVNTSARPITALGGIASASFGALSGVLIWWPDHPHGLWRLSATDTRYALAVAMVAGSIVLSLSSVAPLWRVLRGALSLLGTLAVTAAAVGVLLADVPLDWWARSYATAALVISATVVAYVTEFYVWLPKPVDTAVVSSGHHQLAGRLARHQRALSIYENFTDGRVNDETRLRTGGQTTTLKVPLYRSFLEIEFQQVDGVWDFAFTAFGVTGEDNTDVNPAADRAPRKIDAFEARWDGRLAVSISDGRTEV